MTPEGVDLFKRRLRTADAVLQAWLDDGEVCFFRTEARDVNTPEVAVSA